MALIKCKECGTEYSDNATACIKCGNPTPVIPVPSAKAAVPPKTKDVITGWIFVVLMLFGFFAWLSSCDSRQETKAESAKEVACAKDDLQCQGDKGIVAAGIYCKDAVESLALHEVKWTDGTFESKFSRFRWKDKEKGLITYIGDKAMFQNGFGAFDPVTYFCDLDKDNKTVLDARIMEGKLPK